MDFLLATLTVYILTILVANSYSLDWFREAFRKYVGRIPLLRGPFVRSYDFITCRLCIGFYVSILAGLLYSLPLDQYLPVYALSYFMAMREQP